jgi:hypothetical protein
MPNHRILTLSILVFTFLLLFDEVPQAQIEKRDSSQASFDFPPPPPPPRKLTSSEFTQLYSDINSELDSLEHKQNQYPFAYHYTIENHLRQCIAQAVFSTGSARDTIYLGYTIFSTGKIFLMQILDSKGDIKDQKIIQPIHDCIYEMNPFDRSNDKIDIRSNRPEIISFRSVLVLDNGKPINENDR